MPGSDRHPDAERAGLNGNEVRADRAATRRNGGQPDARPEGPGVCVG